MAFVSAGVALSLANGRPPFGHLASRAPLNHTATRLTFAHVGGVDCGRPPFLLLVARTTHVTFVSAGVVLALAHQLVPVFGIVGSAVIGVTVANTTTSDLDRRYGVVVLRGVVRGVKGRIQVIVDLS